MEYIRVKHFIDVDATVKKWNKECKTDDMWELLCYPVRGDFLIIAFEKAILEDDLFEYRFLVYDLKKQCMWEKFLR